MKLILIIAAFLLSACASHLVSGPDMDQARMGASRLASAGVAAADRAKSHEAAGNPVAAAEAGHLAQVAHDVGQDLSPALETPTVQEKYVAPATQGGLSLLQILGLGGGGIGSIAAVAFGRWFQLRMAARNALNSTIDDPTVGGPGEFNPMDPVHRGHVYKRAGPAAVAHVDALLADMPTTKTI